MSKPLEDSKDLKSSKRFEQFINEKDAPLTRMRSSELEFGSERSKKKGQSPRSLIIGATARPQREV